MRKVAVSVLSSEDRKKDILTLSSTDVDYIHVDVMDGKFVVNKDNPFKLFNKLSSHYKKRLDVHLMVDKPLDFIDDFATLNTEYITIHVELKEDINKLLDLINSYGIKCGIAINPDTNIDLIDKYLDRVDQILVMSVVPGKGGQAFIDDSIERAIKVKKKTLASGRNIAVSMDGGIDDKNALEVPFLDIIVSGSYVVKSDNIQNKIDSLRL